MIVLAVVGRAWRHGLQCAGHVQEERAKDVVAMMAQCDLGCTQFSGHAIQRPTCAAASRVSTLSCLLFGDQPFDDGVASLIPLRE